MTNGGENFPYKQQFLQRQAEWERTQHLVPILEDFMKGIDHINIDNIQNSQIENI